MIGRSQTAAAPPPSTLALLLVPGTRVTDRRSPPPAAAPARADAVLNTKAVKPWLRTALALRSHHRCRPKPGASDSARAEIAAHLATPRRSPEVCTQVLRRPPSSRVRRLREHAPWAPVAPLASPLHPVGRLGRTRVTGLGCRERCRSVRLRCGDRVVTPRRAAPHVRRSPPRSPPRHDFQHTATPPHPVRRPHLGPKWPLRPPCTPAPLRAAAATPTPVSPHGSRRGSPPSSSPAPPPSSSRRVRQSRS